MLYDFMYIYYMHLIAIYFACRYALDYEWQILCSLVCPACCRYSHGALGLGMLLHTTKCILYLYVDCHCFYLAYGALAGNGYMESSWVMSRLACI